MVHRGADLELDCRKTVVKYMSAEENRKMQNVPRDNVIVHIKNVIKKYHQNHPRIIGTQSGWNFKLDDMIDGVECFTGEKR